jgi:hypothetical protein
MALVAADYAAAGDKTQTILNDLFAVDNNNNTLQLENANYLEQAVALFTRTPEHPRQFTVNIGYNLQRAFFPAVHILLPQETKGRYDSIGLSAGEVNPLYNPQGSPPYEIYTLTKTYRATFDLMITSDNVTDVLLIYYLLKAMFPYVVDTFEILGLHNFELTGMDVQLDAAYAPPNIFHRSLRVEFDYQSQTAVRKTRNFASLFNFLLCSNFGDEANPLTPPNHAMVSNNFAINITKTLLTGIVGYVKFINQLTNEQALTVIDLTGEPDSFQITADLTPAPYTVEINLQNSYGLVTGSVGDGALILNNFNTGGQFTYDQFYDMSATTTENLIIDLNFS